MPLYISKLMSPSIYAVNFHLIAPLDVRVGRLSRDYPQGRCFLLVDHMQYLISVHRYS